MASNQLRAISRVVGIQTAVIIARRFGGRFLHVPRIDCVHDLHPLVLTVGLEPARKLAEKFGGTALEIPMEVNAMLELRNDTIVRMFLDGSSITELSLSFGLDRAMIQKIIDKAGYREIRLSRSVSAG